MDLSSELKLLKESSPEKVFKDLEANYNRQISELKAKKYLFGVVCLCDKIEDLVNSATKSDLDYLSNVNLYMYLQRHPGINVVPLSSVVSFGFTEGSAPVFSAKANFVASSANVTLTNILNLLNYSPILFNSENLGNLKDFRNTAISFSLINCKDKILELLVSKELIANLRSEELRLELDSGNYVKSKSHKI